MLDAGLTNSSPTVDARLPDGSRVNVAIRPVAIDGPLVSIRKFSKNPFSMDRLVELNALRPSMADLLKAAVKGKISLIISGGTGSGKTTLLNAMSSYVPPEERIITIEDAAELQLQLPHVGRMETRPPNAEGKGEIRQRELVKNALRMRPDRIIIGECRGEEAFDMLQAMNTGHEGSMTTVHANSPRDAIKRLEQMVSMAGMSISPASIRSQIASAIRLLIQVQRMPDGQRRVISIGEITGMEGEVVQMHEIFRFVKERTDEQGNIYGTFRATGIRPTVPGRPKAYAVGPSAEPLRSKSSFVTAMIPTELWLICALVFGAVLLGFQGIYWVLFKERREQTGDQPTSRAHCRTRQSQGGLGDFAQGEGRRSPCPDPVAAKL